MKLCFSCSSISLAFLLAVDRSHESGRDAQKASRVLRENGATLAKSALRCPMCALVMEALFPRARHRDDPSTHGVDALSADAIMVHPKVDPRSLSFPGPPRDGAYLTGFVVTGRLEDSKELLSGKIRLYTDSSCPGRSNNYPAVNCPLTPPVAGSNARCDILGRPQLSAPDCPDAFALLKRWLQACRQCHGACSTRLSGESIAESAAPPLPTRVLVISDGVVRLVDTEGLTGRYVTLSHCWGPSQKRPLRTTTDNYESHRHGIPWESLPRTFQDAITVARETRFDYIWIDSLCIIQDDQRDWLLESGRMGPVYEMADLTISACHAPDSSQGLFVPRTCRNPAVELPGFFGPLETAQGKVYASVRRETVQDTFPEYGPLNRRAWSTQEWLLSRRMVFYTNGTIMWSCKSITERENGERCFNISRNTRWKTVVEHYSERLLTFPTDKLIALEGLRKEVQKKTGYTFANGIWLESLPDQLLWHVTEQVHFSDAVDPLGLPTWTWAHIPTGVRFLPMHGAKSLCESVSLSQDSRAVVVKARLRRVAMIKPDLGQGSEDDGTFGAIAADVNATRAKNTHSLATFIYDETSRPVGWVVYDEATARAAPTRDFCVQLMGRVSRRDEKAEQRKGRAISSKFREYWILIVRPLSGGGYIRVGAGKTYGQRWWEGEHAQPVLLR